MNFIYLNRGIKKTNEENMIIAVKDATWRKESLKNLGFAGIWLVSLAAVFLDVTQRAGEALRDIQKTAARETRIWLELVIFCEAK